MRISIIIFIVVVLIIFMLRASPTFTSYTLQTLQNAVRDVSGCFLLLFSSFLCRNIIYTGLFFKGNPAAKAWDQVVLGPVDVTIEPQTGKWILVAYRETEKVCNVSTVRKVTSVSPVAF